MPTIFTRNNGRLAFITAAVLWLGYALLMFFAPVHRNTYNLGHMQSFLVQLTIVIPILIIWLTAVYGAVRFKQYAALIQKSADGRALGRLTDGLLLVIVSFIVQGYFDILPRYAVGTSLMEPLVFLRNHAPLVLALVALWFVYTGSARLASQVKAHIPTPILAAFYVPFLLCAILFAVYFYTHLTHGVVNGVPNFAMPGKWPFVTLALPQLVAWFLGLLSIINITGYILYVKGALYRLALRYLAFGIIVVVTFAVFLQLLTLASTALMALNLTVLLLFIYLILIFYAAGFVLIAVGAHKLTRIEAVR